MKSLTTRYLLTCAALGAASGVISVALNYLTIPLSAIPGIFFLWGVIIGVWYLGVTIAQALLRRPGTALITGFVAGIVNFASPYGFLQFPNVLLAALVIEIPFAILLWRRWGDRTVFVCLTISLFAASLFYLYTSGVFLLPPAGAVGLLVAGAAYAAVQAGVSIWIARRLAKAGVGRGLSRTWKKAQSRSSSIGTPAPAAGSASTPTTPSPRRTEPTNG